MKAAPVGVRIQKLLAVCCILAGAATATCSFAQNGDDKRPLNHSDYDKWNSIGQQSLSNNGQWVVYSIQPGKGDSTLVVRETGSSREFTVLRGAAARFTADSQYVAYTIVPDPELVKKLRKEKKKPEEFPQSKLQILHLKTGTYSTVDDVQSFAISEKGSGWIAYRMAAPKKVETVKKEPSPVNESFAITANGLMRKEEAAKGEKPKANPAPSAGSEKPAAAGPKSGESPPKENEAAAVKKKKEKKPGSPLILRNLDTGYEQRFPNVTDFEFNEPGTRLAFATSDEKPEADGVFVIDLAKNQLLQIGSGPGNYQSVVFDKKGDQLAFFTDRNDYESEKPSWSLYSWKSGDKLASEVVNGKSAGIPEGWWIASTASPAFTEDGKRLLFSTVPIADSPDVETPAGEEKPDESSDEPQAKLDIWHWQDGALQPQQLLQAEQERRRSYRAVYDIASKKVIQLANKTIRNVLVNPRSTSDMAMGIGDEDYLKMRSWDSPGIQDSYLVNLKTGKAELVLPALRGSPSLSPNGKYLTWWDYEQQKWMGLSTADPSIKTGLTQDIPGPFFDELHDTPSMPGSHGSAGWSTGEESFLIYDRYDIWQVDPAGGKAPECLTQGEGRKRKIRFRYMDLDPEERFVDLSKPIWLTAFDEATKSSGFFTLDSGAETRLTQKLMLEEDVSGLRKAKDSDDVLFTRSTFDRCPDLWTSTLEFGAMNRISRINPQQHEYRWGTAELVHWKSAVGEELDGLLYKPEGFDPGKKYPMMVYFYERNSDNLHRYHTPAAGGSSINYSFYVSRGYVLFVPDIPYRTGEPGKCAEEAILPGVKSLIDRGFVDEKAIGMQGHSWGGYQTAYLVTRTNMFAAAESGAPVSNMTSAYGGIRWSTGVSRMFQYEKTQSRIGAPLWEARDRYIENSPLFAVEKIETPLLILHNDEDGAVPWYQGIELFVAMRRLNKPVWMLNYNGEPHSVVKRENRLDFAIRMQQFFDHYLKHEPATEWMVHGLPAVDKGKRFGLEPVLPESPNTTGQKADR